MSTETELNNNDIPSLTEEEKAILAKAESEVPSENQFYTTPQYLVAVAKSSLDVIKGIFPDATQEQLNEVTNGLINPVILGLLHEVGYHVTVLSENVSPALRTEPVVSPVTRYMAEHSITALNSVIHGIDVGNLSEQYLTEIGQLDYSWKTTIENLDIPPNGIPIEFVLNRSIHRGKLCYYAYLNENGSEQHVTDIPTYWSNELKAYIPTHAVVYWRELTEPTKPKMSIVPDVDTQGGEVGTAE